MCHLRSKTVVATLFAYEDAFVDLLSPINFHVTFHLFKIFDFICVDYHIISIVCKIGKQINI